MLSRIAQEFADEIRTHDWSDAPYRIDRAGHHATDDSVARRVKEPLTPVQTDAVRTNVMLVAMQVLAHADPQLNHAEFASACGVPDRIVFNSDGRPSGFLRAGLRWDDGKLAAPGDRLED